MVNKEFKEAFVKMGTIVSKASENFLTGIDDSAEDRNKINEQDFDLNRDSYQDYSDGFDTCEEAKKELDLSGINWKRKF